MADVKPRVISTIFGAGFTAIGAARFFSWHAFSIADAIHVGIAIPIGLIAVFVSDYVRQHGGLAFVLVAFMIVLIAASNPAFALGLGVALLGISIAR